MTKRPTPTRRRKGLGTMVVKQTPGAAFMLVGTSQPRARPKPTSKIARPAPR
jgi:hypothetical protein